MNPSLVALKSLFARDLDILRDEIDSYADENKLWIIEGEIKNSAGNLCLHLCGNLQHFMGAVIAENGYVRDREAEFSSKDVPKSQLLSEIEKAKQAVFTALDLIDGEMWSSEYPIRVFAKPMTYAEFMIHLSGHLTYHLGQINYHRRLIGVN